MKNFIIIFLSCLGILSFVACSSSKEDQKRIEQLEAQIAQLRDSISSPVTQEEIDDYVDDIDIEEILAWEEEAKQRQQQEAEEAWLRGPGKFVGEYLITDDHGYKWTLIVNRDGTARMFTPGKEMSYGSWDVSKFHMNRLNLEFADRPVFYFPDGRSHDTYMPKLIGGYFYANSSAADAKNPKLRISAVRVEPQQDE